MILTVAQLATLGSMGVYDDRIVATQQLIRVDVNALKEIISGQSWVE
jgi:hypothetical protein